MIFFCLNISISCADVVCPVNCTSSALSHPEEQSADTILLLAGYMYRERKRERKCVVFMMQCILDIILY